MSVQLHYERLLGDVFAWMVSVSSDPYDRAQSWLEARGLLGYQRYLDLGAGFGAHVRPLAEAGKRVTAVDFNPSLLAQLRENTREHAAQVEVVEGDLVDYLEAADDEWDVVLCVGDTLSHLEQPERVQRLLHAAGARTSRNGRIALAYRDLTHPPPQGTERFIPVAQDDHRTMHCLLEALDDDHMRITDIVTELTPEGPRTQVSDYQKLRLAPDTVSAWAAAAGLEPVRDTRDRGLVSQVFRRRA